MQKVETIFTPADFIAAINQTLEFAYPLVVIEGELSGFRVSKNRWVYFNLKDETTSVPFFGSIYQLPGPLEDGLKLKVLGIPRVHPRFGFAVNFESILPVGEGSLKKAADLLFQKLSAEGLFEPTRKRALPRFIQSVGLITAAGSAAAADFTKILAERWGGVEILLADVFVQGDQAPLQLTWAVEYFNGLSKIPEVLVITRGGGSAEDLAAFNDERVVRAVAASRIPTLVAIGHEVDVSLAELAADQRASTPSNAAQILTPDKNHLLANLQNTSASLAQMFKLLMLSKKQNLQNQQIAMDKHLQNIMVRQLENLQANRRLLQLFDPTAVLKRGYAMVSSNGKYIKSIRQVKLGGKLNLTVVDGKIDTTINKITPDA